MLKDNDLNYIKKACAKECENEQDAEDLVSIIVIKLLSLDKDISKPYRNRLIKNTIINYYTRGPRSVEMPSETLYKTDNESYVPDYLERKDRAEELHKTIWKLPTKQRQIIQDVLKYRSYTQISKDRNMTYDTVKANYRHGLKTLRFLLTRRSNYGILR